MSKVDPSTLIELNKRMQTLHENKGEVLCIEIDELADCIVSGINRIQILSRFEDSSPVVLQGRMAVRSLVSFNYPEETEEFKRPFAVVDDKHDLYGIDIALHLDFEQAILTTLPTFLDLDSVTVRDIFAREL